MAKALLIIMDGWGLSAAEKGNAPLQAKTPTLDYVYANYPKISIAASGTQVGLGPGEPGNSEVGHTNLGAGRVVWENLPRIDRMIESEEFFQNEVLNSTLEKTKQDGKSLHLIGLVSNGGVHSHVRHLVALIDAASRARIEKVYIHAITDGRDTAPQEAEKFFDEVEKATKKFGVGIIATVIGRYFAMDRDKNWDREKKAFDLFVSNTGDKYDSAKAALEANYAKDKSDETVEPAVIGDGGVVAEGDTVIFFNHRSDRFRQIVSLFEGAEHSNVPAGLNLVTMTEYEKGQKPAIIFTPTVVEGTLSELIADKGLKQFHTAETEKYAHVTYFFKAGKEVVLTNEEDVVVPSKKSPTYDKIPEMSAPEVCDKVVGAVEADYDFIVVNFANGDMVGHTGVLEAAIKACETVDECLGKILPLASDHGYNVLITADHGNCEKMIDEETGEPDKEHTANPVPLVHLDFTSKPYQYAETNMPNDQYVQFANGATIGVLADVAPTILNILGIEKNKDMDGMDLTATLR